MKKRILIPAALLVIVTLIAAPLVLAAPHGGRGGHFAGPLGALFRAKEELNLSDQQIEEIKAIFRDLHEQNATYREQLRGGHEAIAEKLLANPNDLAGAQALLDQQAAAERAAKSNLLTATSKALSVLTPEQRARLGQLIDEHKSRRAARGAFGAQRPNRR